jgi:hypothetical protein
MPEMSRVAPDRSTINLETDMAERITSKSQMSALDNYLAEVASMNFKVCRRIFEQGETWEKRGEGSV